MCKLSLIVGSDSTIFVICVIETACEQFFSCSKTISLVSKAESDNSVKLQQKNQRLTIQNPKSRRFKLIVIHIQNDIDVFAGGIQISLSISYACIQISCKLLSTILHVLVTNKSAYHTKPKQNIDYPPRFRRCSRLLTTTTSPILSTTQQVKISYRDHLFYRTVLSGHRNCHNIYSNRSRGRTAA